MNIQEQIEKDTQFAIEQSKNMAWAMDKIFKAFNPNEEKNETTRPNISKEK